MYDLMTASELKLVTDDGSASCEELDVLLRCCHQGSLLPELNM